MFEHDWFATPFVMMTCQVFIIASINTIKLNIFLKETGVFDEPEWDDLLCVLRKLSTLMNNVSAFGLVLRNCCKALKNIE